ncbi:hypothetical protein [Burkholderia stagnalis]|uniref:hypothetical protein n=1 Tax=Burkholderia stagnalis TaxID=1503054 RepID=UPI0009BE6964|nr:hypothetical protein [Burkholderia stagnalis]
MPIQRLEPDQGAHAFFNQEIIMKSRVTRAAASTLLGLLLSSPLFAGTAAAQSDAPSAASANGAAPWDQRVNPAAVQGDAWFDNYRFRDGETLARLKLHYATLGTPHRNAQGAIDNAVLVLHWTGADSRTLLSPTYTKALFDAGRPLDAKRYYLIFPDNVGHGQSSKPSDGMKAKFPNYDYSDIVDLQHKLFTETLGICMRFSACRWVA